MSARAPTASKWLKTAPGSGTLPVFCFPHGGAGSSAYARWVERSPVGIELLPVRPPGRAHRFREPLIDDLEALASAAIGGLAPWLTPPFALLGHCIGGYVAFEVARQLERDRHPEPIAVVVSGCAAPHVAFDRHIHDLPDPEFIAGVRELGGLTDEAIAAPSFTDSVLPALRADCTAAETYAPGAAVIGPPIVALGGDADPLVTPARLRAWQRYSRRGLRMHLLPTGHFYHSAVLGNALAAVASELHRLRIPGAGFQHSPHHVLDT